jgi:RNA polymerase-binding transcription factor DksA
MDLDRAQKLLAADREVTVARRDELARDLRDIVAAASDVATDDEHDPEGATIAYERARTAALIKQADEHLAEIEHALERIDAETYGACEVCGSAIADERLAARPVVRTCISCAARRPPPRVSRTAPCC